VVSLTSSSGGYINGRNSANLELLIDKASSITEILQVNKKNKELNLKLFDENIIENQNINILAWNVKNTTDQT
jgi:hypothetical protein